MTWPLGNFFQAAKAQSLQSLSIGVRAAQKGWVPLAEWRRYSSIRVASSTNTKIILECNRAELHGSVVGEIEVWADRELEMRAQAMRAMEAGTGFQDSWFIVSCYYWAVFSACLLLRLLGTPVFMVKSAEIDALRTLASPAPVFPSEGTFKLTQLGPLSANDELVELKKLKSNYHQSLWSALFFSLRKLDLATKAHNSNPIERDLVGNLLKGLDGQQSRLSDLRNAVNYRSGIGFPASLSGLGFSVQAEARDVVNLTTTSLLTKIARSARPSGVQGFDRVDAVNTSFLFWSAVTLSIMSQTLYREVAQVVKFDFSWAGRRTRFATSNVVGVPLAMRRWAPF